MKKISLTLIATVLALFIVLSFFPSPVTADDNGTIDVGGYTVTLSASPAYAGTAAFLNNYDNTIAVRAELTDVGRFGKWSFSGWIINGQEDSSLSYLVYEVTEDTTIVARFEKQYNINIQTYPLEGGTVDGDRTFHTGDNVDLIAEPAKGWKFVHWKEGEDVISTNNVYSFTGGSSDRSLTAVFERDLDYVKITVTTNTTESGSVTGGGYYKNGNTVTLTAVPNEGWKFTGWDEGGTVVSVDPHYSFTAETDRDLTAKFAQLKYRVEFRNYDGFLLGGVEDGYGNTPEYTGKEPTMPADENHYYVFSGWDPAPGPLTGQDDTVIIYKAQYTKYDRYVLTEGAGGQYVTGSGIPLKFVFQPAAGDNPSAIEHFTGASVDGADLTEGTDFTVKAGSVVLELLPEYLDSLHAGQHTLTVSFDDRFKIDVDVNIVVPPPSNPKTGVSSNMKLYAGILIFAALAAFGIIAYRRKQNRIK